jgi:hypothetical protein
MPVFTPDRTKPISEQQTAAMEYLVYLFQSAGSLPSVDWQESILGQLNFVTSEPAAPAEGARYLSTTTGAGSVTGQAFAAKSIYQWNAGENWWLTVAPNIGQLVYDEGTDALLGYNGSAWATIGSFAQLGELASCAGLSVIGRAGSTTGACAAITGTADQIIAVNHGGTTLAFVTPTGDVTFTSGALTIGAHKVTVSQMAQLAGLSILGVTGAAGADVAAITGAANQVLSVNTGGTALAFAAVTNAMQANMAARTVKLNATNAAAVPTDQALAAYQILRGTAAGTAIEAKEMRHFVYTITAGDVIAQAATIPWGFTAVVASLEYRVATTGAQVVNFTRVDAAPNTGTLITAAGTAFVAGDTVTVLATA